MELHLLRTFQRQVFAQCQYALKACADIETGVQTANTEQVFYGVQNFLSAVANIAKALWGQSGTPLEERRALRESIGIGDESSLHTFVMRNNYEHFDERIIKWWKKSERHNFVDFNVMPSTAIAGVDEVDMFRNLDPETGALSFWGQEFNIREAVSEIQKVFPKLKEEACKPHWETAASVPEGEATDNPPHAATGRP